MFVNGNKTILPPMAVPSLVSKSRFFLRLDDGQMVVSRGVSSVSHGDNANSSLALFKNGLRTERVSATSFVENTETTSSDGYGSFKETRISLACPVCFEPLSLLSSGILFTDCSPRSKLNCSGCKKTYSGTDTHLDLTISSGRTINEEPKPLVTEIFRLPLVSFIYERGWRQNFAVGGFPGPEKEFEMMKEYLNPISGGNIVDASCGTGLFARTFAKSEMFSLVVALDYSEKMLHECHEFIKQDDCIPRGKIMLTRADIARLPFVSSSVDAVHAGAAIHCWPSPLSAVAEICRVLKPGGVFVGTTGIFDGSETFLPFFGLLRKVMENVSGVHIFLSNKEIEDICRASGLVDFTYKRNRQFIMFSARKQS